MRRQNEVACTLRERARPEPERPDCGIVFQFNFEFLFKYWSVFLVFFIQSDSSNFKIVNRKCSECQFLTEENNLILVQNF